MQTALPSNTCPERSPDGNRYVMETAVLIVEDEPMIRLDLLDFFLSSGIATYEAQNAGEALKILSHTKNVGLVFTDIEMPGPMNGMDLAREVRKTWPGVKVVIGSARQDLGPTRAQTSDADKSGLEFIAKPYSPNDLNTLLKIAKQQSEPGAQHGLHHKK